MCGICGIVDFSKTPDVSVVEAMCNDMTHRGPDMGGTCTFDACVLGHRRLSILDLTDAAKQPMLSVDGRAALVFNGEIYNFQELREGLLKRGRTFRTRSDTEVILELYLDNPEDLPGTLNGMFSFALWDDVRKKLIIVRDRLGKKPLYYSLQKNRLSFASELQALTRDRAVPQELSHQALLEYLLYDFIPAPHTIFAGVQKLPPGHMAVFDKNGLTIEKYWEPPEPQHGLNYGSTVEELRGLLDDAVSRRLISDVPLGSFLSGGIDSTLITSLMARNSFRTVKTFSISFPGTTHDESKWSKLAARSIGTDHTERAVNYTIQDIFPEVVRHFGEPFGDSSAIPTWYLSQHTREHVTVALSGDGGDELFGGYERYVARRLQTIYDLVPSLLRERCIEPFVRLLPATTDYYGTSITKKMKLFVAASRRMRENPLAVIPQTFTLSEARLLTGMDYHADSDSVLQAARQWTGLDPVTRMMFTDIQTYMAEDILTKVDRMSMAHSLEVRSPLLDYRVVELACRMPLGFKMGYRQTKKILKQAARGLVPSEILERSKYGFQVPLGQWFKTDLRKWAEDRLLGGRHTVFRRGQVEKIWSEHLAGKADNAHKLWLILIFSEWESQINTSSLVST
ncbi:asparagine synthase (glutamine-hydrolyzing) [Desulfomonile tiedjei]|uniref:asparagine synthase (glutamine-hydrolyzing) n=1 Tax=Desulfomonile tiedjei (strain ATCC 49306 / DSM 6799 / DCB-1) TaxID=706587 RepID=I4C420_DESTA|nr:asparagine synthase (glutamine-hydrolyzing) [Desulfomonile tiedjei]AFM24311.1 asparagine synthase, glutamine-hydrolyzing [Desulfomonile tiedjei DSM 6799]